MIRLNGVSKYFNRRKSNEIRAIDNTSIELGNSGLVTFLGNSGCGKTTLLNAIGGLDKVDKGDIYIDDERMTRRSESKRDELRNLNIGYVFQNYNLIEDDTVFDNVAIVLRMTGMKDRGEIEERVMFVLRRLGIDKYRNRPVKALSGGERQRVGIARAIVKNPKIIIADEPTGNLDSRNTIEIMNIIKAISREKLVILVTHERDIAEFYADRVVEIVDGRIVSDRENHPAEDLDYRLENKIYLRDLPVSEELTSPDGLKISYYSDRKVQPDSIKVVIKSGNVYVYTDEHLSYGSESMEIVDDHYRKISKDVYEDYDFNYRGTEGFVPKYTSIYTMGSSLATGFRKIRSYSVIKKILLIGFVLASMFIIYAVSNIAGITNITDDKFLTVNRDYLTVKTGALSEEQLEKYSDMDGMDYVLPGDSMVTFIMPLDDYFQSNGGRTTVEGSLAATDKIPADSVVSGKLPEKDGELVIDKVLADRLLNKGGYSAAIQVGIDSYEDLIGRTLQIPGYKDYTISAVADTGSPCIYAARDELLDITVNRMSSSEADAAMYGETGTVSEGANIKPYSAAAGNDEIKIVSGTAPEEDYQVLLPEEMRYEYYIGSKIDTKINDTRLTVSGFYSDARMGGAYYVSDHTKLISVLSSMTDVTLAPSDKDGTYAELSAEGVRVVDNYAQSRAEYIDSIRSQIVMTLLVAGVILIISLIEIYLMLRASFLSRVKEVGVLRAIGLKKKDIYKMFAGEAIVLTAITAIPSMAVMAYIINGVCKVSYVAAQFMMNPLIFFISLAIVFVFNMIAGLLPVFNTLRKTPAAILARNDVN